MPTSRGLLYGWELMKHIRAMQSKGIYYISPWIYEPMRLNPPPPTPNRVKPPPKIVLPSDALKKRIERYSVHGQDLSRNVLPHDYSRRTIDLAAARVKDLMRHDERLSEKDAIKIFDREYEHEVRMKQREADMLREDAINSGQALTVLDGLHILEMMRDLQTETKLINDKKKEVALKRASRRREQFTKNISEKASISSNIEEDKELSQITVEDIHFTNKLRPMERYQINRYHLQRALSPNQIKRINEASMLKDFIIYVRDLKLTEYEIPNGAYSTDTNISPFDFLALYIKAYQINKPKGQALDIEREQALYRGEAAHNVFNKLANKFKQMFERFKIFAPIEVDYQPVLQKIGIESKQQREKEDILARIAFPRIDFSSIIDAMEEYDFEGFSALKKDQPHIEDFFYSLQLREVIREHYADKFTPLMAPVRPKVPDRALDDVADEEKENAELDRVIKEMKKEEDEDESNY
jgi:hypothetical protein